MIEKQKACLPCPAGRRAAGRGCWIAFEGNDGCGKSDQCKRFAEYLTHDLGIGPVVETREPGGCFEAEKIKNMLFLPKLAKYPIVQLHLLLAARHLNIFETVEPSIAMQAIVLQDRSEGSTIAYQVFQYGLDYEIARAMNDFATAGWRPDLTMLLDVDEKVGWQRKHASKEGASNYFDNADFTDLQNRRKGYLWQAKNYKKLDLNPWVVIDANRPKDEVFKDVVAAVKKSGLIRGI
ncbi:dTMP kinase [Candidatus Daviesbacteria bacterium]|nr:dTMP kinase [Candidatus Daviesbacteria bacterium]